MQLINFNRLQEDKLKIKADYQSKKPFRYVMFENFFQKEKADLILNNYPEVKVGEWDGTTYLDQKNKFQKTDFETGSIMEQAFKEINSEEFRAWLNDVTEIEEPLLADEKLFGGGLHQSVNGAFLNVHVDYNIHPETNFHRRLNVIVYMNKEWEAKYEGNLELWDLSGDSKKQIGDIQPLFNRCVIFETNEISFHGHPKKLNTPKGMNRKSLATYYYTKSRPAAEITESHNTVYVNTEGVSGKVKRFNSGVKALLERINNK